MPPRTRVRQVTDYPPSYFIIARGIALKAIPTLNNDYDDPPRAGPFDDMRSIKVFRASWHNFRETLRINSAPGSPPAQLFNIINNLTTRTTSVLQTDGSEQLWLEFAPHPVTLVGWRTYPELFEAEKRRHANFVASLQS
jgi:hypothetical protein